MTAKPWLKWVIGVPIALVVLATAGTWGYINLVKDEAPDRLSLDTDSTASSQTTTSEASAAGSGNSAVAATAASGVGGVDGTWKIAAGSQAGYRVKEILFGQSAEGVGRTDDVTGQIVIAGTQVSSGSFTVDMTTVASDESRRDNQFRGRIMDTATHPTSTFELTEPIDLGDAVPAVGQQVAATAKGELTLRGTTKVVTVDVNAERTAEGIKIAGSIPIVFADWGIPNPSFGPADTEDNGILEFLLVLAK